MNLREKTYLFLFDKKGWIPVIFILLFVFTVIYMPTITSIIMFSLFFSYAISPLVGFLTEKLKFPRVIAVAFIMFLIILLIVLLTIIVLPIIFQELSTLIKNLPAILGTLVAWFEEKSLALGINMNQSPAISQEVILEKLSSLTPFMNSFQSFVEIIFKQTFMILGLFVNFIIFAVITFFVSLKLPFLYSSFQALLPKDHKRAILYWIQRFDTVLSGFIRGQLTVGFVLGSLYALGLTIAGLEAGGSFGAMMGVFCLVPYVGLFSGFVIISLMALSKGGFLLVLKIVIVFLAIQICDTIFITPNIMGKKVGISPVFVIIALFAGAEIGGFLGILVAVPTFAILKIISEDMIARYKESDFYKGQNNITKEPNILRKEEPSK